MADGDSTLSPQDNPQSLAWQLAQGMAPQAPVPPDIPQSQNAPMPPPPDVGQDQTQAPPPSMQGTPQPQQQQVPKMGGMPLIANYLMNVIRGPQGGQGPNGQPIQPVSRGDMTLNFLSQFLGNMAAGMQQSGHGPGANIRGAGAAMMAPYQRSLQEYQLGQQQQAQQAQIQGEQARTALTQAQAESYKNVIQTPLGPMNERMAERVFPSAVRGVEAAQARVDPTKKVLGEASDAYARGDMATYQAKLKQAGEMAATTKSASPIWGKLTPEMAATGVPPDPKDYPLGLKDPKFLAAVQDYGSKVTDLKQKNLMQVASARGESYARSRAQYMQVPVLTNDPQTGEPGIGFASPLQIAGNPSAYKPLVEGDKLMMKNAVFEDIKGATDNLQKAYTTNPDTGKPGKMTPFSPVQVAQMTAAMDADPSGGLLRQTVTNLASAGGKASLDKQQQSVAIAMAQTYENAYALRGVAGFGQGSDELRRAIRNTLPGVSSPPDYALNQLEAFRQQVGRLERGIPSVRLRSNVPQPNAAPAAKGNYSPNNPFK